MLAGVCSYFNPCGYKKRLSNYDVFRRAIKRAGLPLLTIELLFDWQESSLGGTDVVTIRGGDVMWQKERLLQIGIDRLLDEKPDGVIWFDADIVFEQADWLDKITASLDRFDCVQSFETLCPYFSRSGRPHRTVLLDPVTAAMGGSWAARSEFWRAVPLYQHCIIGGGDHVMAKVFTDLRSDPDQRSIGKFDTITIQRMNTDMRRHIDQWAQSIRGDWRVGYVGDVSAYLLSHGQESKRRYAARHLQLADYDPECDIRLAPSGCWRWSTSKPELHKAVADYFRSRMEDTP
jgi:hypothetical protein